MSKPSSGGAGASEGKRRVFPSIIIVIMLVTVSAVAVVASSEGILSERPSDGTGGTNTGLTIEYVSCNPGEAYVDQLVEWTVNVSLQDQGQRGKGLLFTWDWDDGTYTVNHLNSVGSSDTAVDTQTHAWSEPGTYAVEVSVWDGYGSEQNRFHNVSAEMPFTVNPAVGNRSVDYRWYDMFGHPLGDWYDVRVDTSNEWIVRDEYPYIYVWEGPPAGNIQTYSFMRMEMTANDLPELNMNENPEFIPLFSDVDRGGTAVLGWYINYVTKEECQDRLTPAQLAWYDGWYIGWNGTVLLDEEAAKSVLGITSEEFEYFDAWWSVNGNETTLMWLEWMMYEAGPQRLAIFNMYEWDLQFVDFDMDALKIDPGHVLLQFDTISWGMEALMTRWLREAFMPTEWYFEDMYFHATIGPESADVDLDAAVGYSVFTYDAVEDGGPCWVWQAMMQDYVWSSPPGYPPSLFEPYVGLEYLNRHPGSDWYGEMMPYDYTPGAWNLSAGETLTLEWPSGDVLFFVNDPVSMNGTMPGVTDLWGPMTVSYSEPLPSDAPSKVAIDDLARTISFVGPFDMWSWSKNQATHPYLADEWDRLGILPWGAPYIEFRATGEFNTPPSAAFTVSPDEGTVGTVFEFDASSSWDAQDPTEALEVRWDWESDGIWDTAMTTTKVATHAYSSPGTYTVSLQVMDSGGVSGFAYKPVQVSEPSGPIPHDPIEIHSDLEFTSENGVVGGSGTASDPYIIEGWDISAPLTPGILVENVGSSFVIRDVHVHSDSGENEGVLLLACSGMAVVEDSMIEGFRSGIVAGYCFDLLIRDNIIAENSRYGIFLELCFGQVEIVSNTIYWNGECGVYNNDSMDAFIFQNGIYNNTCGVTVTYLSENVTVLENEIMGNEVGIRILQFDGMQYIWVVSNNLDNEVQVTTNTPAGVVSWDGGYATGGNFWADYSGVDIYSGPGQDEPGSDGIGDTPYVIDDANQDGYPLMEPFGSVPEPPPVPGPIMWVSNGTSVTVFEQTGEVYSHTFSVDELMTTGGSFTTVAMLLEEYLITSDGVFLTVHCYRDPLYPIPGTGTGNNIVAVRLDGVPGYPDGLWASVIVDYTIGTDGIEESRWNALGPSDQLGPYGDSLCTYMGDHDSELVLGFTSQSTPPGETSLTYRIYDLFGETWGDWWVLRQYAAWDLDRPLTYSPGEATMLSAVSGTPKSTTSDQGIIYAPYRYAVTGTSIPNVKVHQPVFMPVLGSAPVTGAEAAVSVAFDYITESLWEGQVLPEWGSHPDWSSSMDDILDWNDGWLVWTEYEILMNREAAEELLGLPQGADPASWWLSNEAYIADAWENWIMYQGNYVYDIYNGYEWPYTVISPMFTRLAGDSSEVVLETAHVNWGYEVLVTRWLLASELSVHQPYMEDFEMTLDLRESECDVQMDAVCQWSMHCVKQASVAPGVNAPCAWAWEPIGLDYVMSTSMHPDSQYDPYYGLAYHSWNCGDPQMDTEVPYEVAPWAMSLPSYAKLVFELPTGSDVIGYYADFIYPLAMKDVWLYDDYSAYDDLRYYGEMTVGHMELGGCTDWIYNVTSNVLTINGPWDFTYPHPDDPSLLYRGAPWIEFNVDPVDGGAAGTESSSASSTVVSEAASLAATMSGAVLVTVMLVACAGRRREY